jgi:hypothetical protein
MNVVIYPNDNIVAVGKEARHIDTSDVTTGILSIVFDVDAGVGVEHHTNGEQKFIKNLGVYQKYFDAWKDWTPDQPQIRRVS